MARQSYFGPIGSALGAGVVATVVYLLTLTVGDALVPGYDRAVLSVIAVLFGVENPTSYVIYAIVYVIVWPLLFATITEYLPGGSGQDHGVILGVTLWMGYAAVAWLLPDADPGSLLTFLLVSLVAYVLYGYVLGAVYDFLVEDRMFTV